MRTFLLLHGWGGNADSFTPISQYLARIPDCQVLTPSFLCPPREVYTLDNYVADLENYLRQHNVTRCVVIAHSFGARLVALMNARYPQLFTQIIITGGAGLRCRSFRVWWKVKWYRLLRRCGVRLQGGSRDYRQLDANGKRTFQNIIHRDLTNEVAQITAPTLLIWGTRDKDTPLCQMRRWQRLVPHAEKICYRGKGHFAYLEDSARFINDVMRFLRKHERRSDDVARNA